MVTGAARLVGRIWSLSFILGLVALACAPQAAAPGAPAAAPAAEAPKYGGVLHLTPPQPNQTLDPYFSPGVGASLVLKPVYETLLEYKQDRPEDDYRVRYEVIPWLAESWEQPTPTTYVFKLRKGVKWHDGQEFTGEDVKFSYERLGDPKNAFPDRGLVRDIKSIEVPEPHTVRITLSRPWAEFLQNLGEFRTALLPKHAADKGIDFKKEAIGTGPFRLKRYDLNKEGIYVKNENYRESGKPYVNGLRLTFGLDKAGIVAATTAERNDYYVITDQKQFDAVKQVRPDLQSQGFVGEYNYGIRFNLSKKPYDDVRVRRAIHLAVDRHTMNETVAFGVGGINQPVAPSIVKDWAIPQEELFKMPGFRKDKTQDLAEAKRLLAQAGYPNGFDAELTYYVTYSVHPAFAEFLSAQLRKINLNVSLKPMELAAGLKAYREGDFDITLLGGGIWPRPDAYLVGHWHSKAAQNKTGPFDPKLDALIDKQGSATDFKERVQTLLEINRYMIDNAYYVSTIDGGLFMVWQPYVKNLYYSYSGQPWLRRPAWLWLEVDKLPAWREKSLQ